MSQDRQRAEDGNEQRPAEQAGQHQDWEQLWRGALREYLGSGSGDAGNQDVWSPQLNDQDLFNAIFEVEPGRCVGTLTTICQLPNINC